MKIGLGLALLLVACGGATSTEAPASDPSTSSASTAEDPAATTPAPSATEEAAPAPRRPPPPAAFDACASKVAGDVCAFDGHEGACITPPPDAPDDRVVCRPSDAPPCDGPLPKPSR